MLFMWSVGNICKLLRDSSLLFAYTSSILTVIFGIHIADLFDYDYPNSIATHYKPPKLKQPPQQLAESPQ